MIERFFSINNKTIFIWISGFLLLLVGGVFLLPPDNLGVRKPYTIEPTQWSQAEDYTTKETKGITPEKQR